MVSHVVYDHFQPELGVTTTAQHVFLRPTRTQSKPRLQSDTQQLFRIVKLRHVDQTHAQTKPPSRPESPGPPAPSCHSAVQFMLRIRQRLREVDEHVSEVMHVFYLLLFSSLLSLLHASSLKRPLIIYHVLIIHSTICSLRVKKRTLITLKMSRYVLLAQA